MLKLHLCCGDIYLERYLNCDISGYVITEFEGRKILVNEENHVIEFEYNPNETTLDKYFKYPFGSVPRRFILDKRMNILEKWPWKDSSVDEIVLISAIEHFNPRTELPHIIKEINRVIKIGGKLIVDWPDIKKQVEMYYESDPEMMLELLYCNHKNQYSIHHWGFTEETFKAFLGRNWSYEFKEVVQHAYPMMGCETIKKG